MKHPSHTVHTTERVFSIVLLLSLTYNDLNRFKTYCCPVALFGREQKILSWISCLMYPVPSQPLVAEMQGRVEGDVSGGRSLQGIGHTPFPSLPEAFALAVLWALAKKSFCTRCSHLLSCGFFLPFLQKENDVSSGNNNQESIVREKKKKNKDEDWIHLYIYIHTQSFKGLGSVIYFKELIVLFSKNA